jgi:tetratricopeptide (TPR) repeat protein
MYGNRKITIVFPKLSARMIKHFNPQKIAITGLAVLFLAGFTLFGCKNSRASEASDELSRAKKLIAQGNYTEAFMQLNQALAEAPRDPNVHLNLGWLYLYTGDIANAQKELAAAEMLGPDLAETFHLKGALSAQNAQQAKTPEEARERQEVAVESYNKALERDSANHQTYFDLASSLSALGRYEETLSTLDKGFEHIPEKDLETQVNFQIASCSAEAKLQMFEEAIADCNQALEFTTSPASKERIEEMIENMKLMNPGLVDKATKEAEENAVLHEATAD